MATWAHDPHADHQATQIMARAVARRGGLAVLSYPVWAWLLPPEVELDAPAITGWRLDISAHLPAKRAAIAAHASQVSDLIADVPGGARVPPALLAALTRTFEVFVRGG